MGDKKANASLLKLIFQEYRGKIEDSGNEISITAKNEITYATNKITEDGIKWVPNCKKKVECKIYAEIGPNGEIRRFGGEDAYPHGEIGGFIQRSATEEDIRQALKRYFFVKKEGKERYVQPQIWEFL